MESACDIQRQHFILRHKVAKRLNLVTDYADFMEIQNAGLIANGQAPRFAKQVIDEWRNDAGRKSHHISQHRLAGINIYRNPSVVELYVSLTGGSKRVRYNMSRSDIPTIRA